VVETGAWVLHGAVFFVSTSIRNAHTAALLIACLPPRRLRCKERSMWSFTLRMIRQIGCRDLRPVELEYLRRIVLKSVRGELPRALATGAHFERLDHRHDAPAE
jgi:hypothetical protein